MYTVSLKNPILILDFHHINPLLTFTYSIILQAYKNQSDKLFYCINGKFFIFTAQYSVHETKIQFVEYCISSRIIILNFSFLIIMKLLSLITIKFQ